jgi:hypothetical protein
MAVASRLAAAFEIDARGARFEVRARPLASEVDADEEALSTTETTAIAPARLSRNEAGYHDDHSVDSFQLRDVCVLAFNPKEHHVALDRDVFADTIEAKVVA